MTPGFRFCVPSEGTEAKGAHKTYTANRPQAFLGIPAGIYGGVFGFYLKSSKKTECAATCKGARAVLFMQLRTFLSITPPAVAYVPPHPPH